MKCEIFNWASDFDYTTLPFQSGDPTKTAVIMFGAPKFIDSPEPIRLIAEAYPGSPILGCSTSGEIFGSRVQEDSLVFAVLQLERSWVKATGTPITIVSESYQAGKTLAQNLMDPMLRGILVLSDGLKVNGSELVRGLNAILPPDVVVTGGLAGDGPRFERTWVVHEGQPMEGFITGLGFYGESMHIGFGSKGGWDKFGPERKVTRSEGNVLYELDGKPALELYKKYLGERATDLPAAGLFFPLAIRISPTDEHRVVRTILAIDESTQSMTFAGDIPERSLAQLMQGNFDHLVAGASEAASLIHHMGGNGDPTLCIAISCVGRKLVLSERTEEEIEATLEVLPKGTQQMGFYSYGEISPSVDGPCDLHNQTMTLTTLTEL